MIKLTCPHCGEALSIPEKYAGKTGVCKLCKSSITVPSLVQSNQPRQSTNTQKESRQGLATGTRNKLLLGGSIFVLAWVILVSSLVVTVRKPPTIDASSEESMKESISEVRRALSEPKRTAFDEALQTIVFEQIDMSDFFLGGGLGAGVLTERVREAVDGRTGKQIIAEAEQFEAKRQAERVDREAELEAERERLGAELADRIQEFQAKRTAAERSAKKLEKFEIVRSRFYIYEGSFSDRPVIELTVRNGTDHAVSRAYFEGTLASPGRSVPWVKDTFNYNISGGLESGEVATWTLAPNPFSDWGTVDTPLDAILSVTVERLDGPDGETLYSTREFTEWDRQRLDELKRLKREYDSD